jgi:hypothetical protein
MRPPSDKPQVNPGLRVWRVQITRSSTGIWVTPHEQRPIFESLAGGRKEGRVTSNVQCYCGWTQGGAPCEGRSGTEIVRGKTNAQRLARGRGITTFDVQNCNSSKYIFEHIHFRKVIVLDDFL